MREMEKREGVSDVFMRRARAKGDEFRERVRTPYVFRICGKEESLGEIKGEKELLEYKDGWPAGILIHL